MRRTEVELPDALYEQVEGLALRLHLSVPEVLAQAAEQMVLRHPKTPPRPNGGWQFPEARHLGAFRASVGDWRLLASEAMD